MKETKSEHRDTLRMELRVGAETVKLMTSISLTISLRASGSYWTRAVCTGLLVSFA